jgi:hypothetical protein
LDWDGYLTTYLSLCASLLKTVKELEIEKNARGKMKQACDELASMNV